MNQTHRPLIKTFISAIVAISLILQMIFDVHVAVAAEPLQEIRKIITDPDAVILASPTGEIILSVNADQKLIPASTLKLLTSLVAIHTLGETYRYPTDFFVDEQSNLIIKGYGDPLLVSEEIEKIATALRPLIGTINDIVLDDTFFEKPVTIPGTVSGSLQPYDAPNGALCVNFNTVNFRREKSTIISAEPQTPIVEIARKRIRSSNAAAGRILLTNNGDEITRYAGEMFQSFFRSAGIRGLGEIRMGTVSLEKDTLVYRHVSSYQLTEIIRRLLEYSNNFMANQLLLTAGAAVFGAPASMDKGVRAAKNYIEKQFGWPDAVYTEGSGISKNNRLTVRMFLDILREFKPYHDLMPHANDEYYKTGTLTGVSTRAGYLVRKGDLYPFAVLINTPGKTPAPVMKQLNKQVAAN